MNSNTKFAAFYATFIAVALIGSLYANHLNPSWNRKVFTFPSEVQKVVENGTAIMEIQWRWLPETLEIIVTVNDDETNTTFHPDGVSILFDSDNNEKLTSDWPDNWRSKDDHAVCMFSKGDEWFNHTALVGAHCWVDSYGHVRSPVIWCAPPIVACLDNSTTCTFNEGEGYVFTISIPIELINVKPPTSVIMNYFDSDYIWAHYKPEASYEELRKVSTLVVEFEM